MALSKIFLQYLKILPISFIFACFSRDTIGPIVKVDETIDGAKYKTILEDHMLPSASDTMVTGRKMTPSTDGQ